MDTCVLTRVVQQFECPGIDDLETAVAREIRSLLARHPLEGRSVAVAVGSRGISCLADAVRSAIRCLRESAARPFIIPAMGSHGGGTAQGQREVLESCGITETAVGAEVRSCMDVVELGTDERGTKVYMDRLAREADHTIIINRIKPHTDFHGPLESGLIKMCVIGMGNHAGAREIHSYGIDGLRTRIAPCARVSVKRGNILGGIAIVENACHEPMLIRGVPAREMEAQEQGLLAMARENMASLPTEDLDVLLIDRVGKDISGTGVDTTVIGRIRISGQPEPDTPRIGVIVADALTPESHGNALGMGLLDIVTRRFLDSIDPEVTRENVLTSSFLERGKLPVVAPSYTEGVQWALRAAGVRSRPRLARIRDTLHLREVYVSEAVLEDIRTWAPGRVRITSDTMECTEEWI